MSTTTSWYVLQHSAGPAVPDGESMLDQAGIAGHDAFLARRRAAGEAVAAGLLPDDDGRGLTVLDVPSLDEAVRLATQDDQAVVDGLLTVTVREWPVVMAHD